MYGVGASEHVSTELVMTSSPTVTSSSSVQFGHPLYSHGVCRWPGCGVRCTNVFDFNRHLHSCHPLDDVSMAQAQLQMHIVNQQLKQLNNERKRLQVLISN
ncbi:unnamed protein product, partial [Meganyctiphanes norvegica]